MHPHLDTKWRYIEAGERVTVQMLMQRGSASLYTLFSLRHTWGNFEMVKFRCASNSAFYKTVKFSYDIQAAEWDDVDSMAESIAEVMRACLLSVSFRVLNGTTSEMVSNFNSLVSYTIGT